MLSYKGFVCLLCYTSVYSDAEPTDTPDFTQRAHSCACGNLAVIWDEDVTPRLYVNDITTVQRAIIITHEGKEVRRELLKPFNYALFEPLDFKSSPLLYQDVKPRRKYERKTSTKYDESLITALERYKNTTSDGNEEFKRTTLSNPLKES